MDELISAARIGRSLGVHLILATQKPSGVVNAQIWSNARFIVSLKVSDAADSREMIRREDAAEITQSGRFYMLAGEVDDPDSQRQYAFVVDVVSAGNILLYGSQNADVDGLLQAMLVSLAKTYTAEELWIYAVDYGVGTLAALVELPHRGGIVLTGDVERVHNLFRMLSNEIQERRTLFAPYGGSIETYNQKSGQMLPRMVIALANLASFQELDEDLAEELVAITRDAPRYGLHF